MLFKFLFLFSCILYSSEKEQKNYFAKSLNFIENRFFNEDDDFNCDTFIARGQEEGFYILYGLQGRTTGRGNLENFDCYKGLEKWKANFNDIKSGHFCYAISGILLHFLLTIYSAKKKCLYFANMTNEQQEEAN